ncbi:MAG: tetratricopeptide repeat protein [archaeon]|nr:tetratricopeptide repeat protein [archaeon]
MYDWTETNTSLTIIIPIPYKLDKKKIDYTITELYVKINMLELKRIHIIDLFDAIDFTQGKMVLEDNRILFILPKLEDKLWKNLEFKGSKAEIKERRKKAEDKYYEKIKQEREIAAKTKSEFQQFATDRSIAIDDARRQEIRDKKSSEKTKAEKDLYSFVDQMEKGNYRKVEGVDEDDETAYEPINKTNKNTKEELKEILEVEEEEIDTSSKKKEIKPSEEHKATEEHNIREDEDEPIVEDIKKEEPEIIKIESPMVQMENSFQKAYKNMETQRQINIEKSIPKKEPPKPTNPKEQSKIREQKKVEINLTEQKIPHFAARESLSKEPPYPKSKKYVPEKNYLGQEIEDRNPIWIKEKADNFYKNKDFISAINAYNKSLDLDPSFHKCLMNRGTCYLSIGEFDLALNDFNKVIDLIDKLDPKEKEQDNFYDRIKLRTLVKIYAVYSLQQNYQNALEIIENKLLIPDNNKPYFIDKETWKKIEYDKKIIQNRMNNEEKKKEGDSYLSKKDYINAKKIYESILEMEPENERVLSNLSLIYLAQNNYDEVIECCNKIIKIFKQFKEKIKFKNINNSFEIKVLLRRAKCYEIKNEMHLAEKDINSIEKLSIKNEQILKEIKTIKDKLKIRVVESYKETANNYLSQGNFSDALSYYDKAIALIKFSNIYNKIDLVKILLNRIGCLIKLTQYDSTYLEFEKILMILSKQKAIADIQSNLVLKEEVNKLEFLTYVKRAYVYTINHKIKDAMKDYEDALKINPSDSKIRENLEKLKLLN